MTAHPLSRKGRPGVGMPAQADDTQPCHDCGQTYYEHMGGYWLAPDDLWAEVVNTTTVVLCPPCFGRRAKAAGIAFRWQAVREAEEPMPDGRSATETCWCCLGYGTSCDECEEPTCAAAVTCRVCEGTKVQSAGSSMAENGEPPPEAIDV